MILNINIRYHEKSFHFPYFEFKLGVVRYIRTNYNNDRIAKLLAGNVQCIQHLPYNLWIIKQKMFINVVKIQSIKAQYFFAFDNRKRHPQILAELSSNRKLVIIF